MCDGLDDALGVFDGVALSDGDCDDELDRVRGEAVSEEVALLEGVCDCVPEDDVSCDGVGETETDSDDEGLWLTVAA